MLSAEFSPSGEHILTASQDGTAHLLDLELQRIAVYRSDGGVKSARFSPDGKLVVTASYELRRGRHRADGAVLADR